MCAPCPPPAGRPQLALQQRPPHDLHMKAVQSERMRRAPGRADLMARGRARGAGIGRDARAWPYAPSPSSRGEPSSFSTRRRSTLRPLIGPSAMPQRLSCPSAQGSLVGVTAPLSSTRSVPPASLPSGSLPSCSLPSDPGADPCAAHEHAGVRHAAGARDGKQARWGRS